MTGPPANHNALVFAYQMFPDLTVPYGFLHKNKACQALWYYAVIVINREFKKDDDLLRIEGEWPVQPNYRQLFTSIATMYACQPEEMLKFWINVDMQLNAMGSKLRVAEEFRFRKTAELRTQ